MKANNFNTVSRPNNFNPNVWNVLRKVAAEIWSSHNNGKNWNRQVLISCKEFYNMLLDENGNLILSNKELVRFAQNGHIRSWANELLLEGLNLLSAEEFDLAIQKFELYQSIAPNSVLVYAKLAEAYMGKLAFKPALENIKLAIAKNGTESGYFALRAKIYTHMDQDEKAMNDLNFALLLDKENAQALAQRGAVRMAKGEVKEAISDLKKAVRVEPQKAFYQHLLLKALMQSNKLSEAFKVVKAILNANPFDAEALFVSAQIRLAFRVEEYKAEDELLLARSLGNSKAEQLLLDFFSPMHQLGFVKAA